MKSADDTYIQVNPGHNALNPVGANRAGLTMDTTGRMFDVKQIPRSANLVAQNPKTADGFRYPDSVSYGFRIGSATEGVGPLADSHGGTVQDVFIMDCTFANMHTNPMETIALSSVNGITGFNKTFNGNGLRPFGYTNSLSNAASMAPAALLLSKEALENAIPAMKSETYAPIEEFNVAAKAVTNTTKSGWSSAKAHGLYKGSDVIEASLAALEAIGLLKKYFTAAGPVAVLGGLDNSNIDIGVLALRKSMMVALDAATACHIGLKGGFNGDIFADDNTYYGYGEIYPWYVKTDGSVDIDKDVILSQQNARADRRQTTSYLAVELPACSDSIFKLKQVSADTMALVKADTEAPVTYQNCADLLGFGNGSAQPVIYKMTRNLDGQHHNHKGIFGVRLDNVASFAIDKVVVKDLETSQDPYAKPVKQLGSVAQQLASGVQISDEMEPGVLKVRAFSINSCTEGSIEDVSFSDSFSGGFITGVEIRGKSADIQVAGVTVESIEGMEKAVGLKVSKSCADIEISKVRTSEITISEIAGSAVPVEIESADVIVKK